MIMMVH